MNLDEFLKYLDEKGKRDQKRNKEWQQKLQAMKDEIKQEANKLPEGAMDELVHSAKSEEAASINNQGIEEQIEYLLLNMNGKELIEEIKQQQ